MRHRLELLRVETAQERIEPGRGITALVDLGGVKQALPDRELIERVRLSPRAKPAHDVVGGGRIENHAPSIADRRDT